MNVYVSMWGWCICHRCIEELVWLNVCVCMSNCEVLFVESVVDSSNGYMCVNRMETLLCITLLVVVRWRQWSCCSRMEHQLILWTGYVSFHVECIAMCMYALVLYYCSNMKSSRGIVQMMIIWYKLHNMF